MVVAMSGLNRTAAPASLLQTEAQARYAAMQRVASAQAKVARDIAALRRTEAQTGIRPHSQQLKDFDYNMYDLTKYGPKAPADLREHRKGGLPLEDPENEFIHTPRIHHKHKFGPLVRCAQHMCALVPAKQLTGWCCQGLPGGKLRALG